MKKRMIFRCIDPENKNDCEWALNYLRNKGLIEFRKPGMTAAQTLQQTDGQALLDKESLRLLDMAYRQRKKREKEKAQNRKSYNFSLSAKAAHQLERLCRDFEQSVPDMIELIVDESTRDIQWGRKVGAERARLALKTKQAIQYRPSDLASILRKEAKTLTEALRSRDALILEQTQLISTLQAKIQSWGLEDEEEGPGYQEIKAKLFSEATNNIGKRLDSNASQIEGSTKHESTSG